MKKYLFSIIISYVLLLCSCSTKDDQVEKISYESSEKPYIGKVEQRFESPRPTNESQVVMRESLPVGVPVDFNFILNYGIYMKNSIDTFSNKITKDLIDDGIVETEFILSEEDKFNIYKMMIKISVHEYPTHFISPHQLGPNESYEGPDHYSSYRYIIHADGRDFEINWDDKYYIPSIDDVMGDKLRKLNNLIEEIIMSSEEYKSLPEFSGGYD